MAETKRRMTYRELSDSWLPNAWVDQYGGRPRKLADYSNLVRMDDTARRAQTVARKLKRQQPANQELRNAIYSIAPPAFDSYNWKDCAAGTASPRGALLRCTTKQLLSLPAASVLVSLAVADAAGHLLPNTSIGDFMDAAVQSEVTQYKGPDWLKEKTKRRAEPRAPLIKTLER